MARTLALVSVIVVVIVIGFFESSSELRVVSGELKDENLAVPGLRVLLVARSSPFVALQKSDYDYDYDSDYEGALRRLSAS